jgi:predicted DNA-binding transcriptional regulator YafY
MAGRGTKSRLGRLEELKGLLAADDYATVGALAGELGVSERTLARDLALLRDAGLPIDSDRGRGGGVRLLRSWSLGRLQLDHAEAVDLLLSLAIAERIGSPLFLQHLAPIRRKVAAAFSDRQADLIRGLRRRILLGDGASETVLAGYKAPARPRVAAVAAGFFEMRRMQIEYAGADGRLATRRIDAHYMLYNPPVWYLLTYDHLREDVRSFRIDRIRSVEVCPETFRLRPRDHFVAAADIGAEQL